MKIFTFSRSSRQFFGALFIFLFAASGFGQVATNYTFSQSTGTYSPITGGTQFVTTTGGTTSYDTDGSALTLPIASRFTFNGTLITSVNMTADGSLWLNPSTTTTGNAITQPILSTGIAAGIIAGLAMDLRSTSIASQVYERRWEDTSAELVFQWQNVARYLQQASERFSFQIRIEKSTGIIRVVYGDMIGITTSTTYIPQVGLRGTSNTDYNARRLTTGVPDASPSWDDTVAATNNAHNLRFTSTSPSAFPSSGLTYTWTPALCSALPTSLSSNSVNSNSATISWSAASPAPGSGYEYYVSTSSMPAPTAAATATGSVGAGTTSANLSGLSPATPYYFWVRSNCDGTNKSAWAGSGTFTTSCAPELAPTNTQTFVTFTGAAPAPACWSEATGSVAATSTLSGTTSKWTNSTGFANTGTNVGAKINLYGTNAGDWLISNQIDLGSTPGLYRVKYNMAVTSYAGTTAQTTLGTHIVRVIVSTDGGNTWSNANTIKTYTGVGTYSNTGQIETINLTGYSGIVKIAFVATTSSTSPDIDFHIDDFKVELVPTDAVDYANIQFPGVSTTTPGTSVDIFGQAYKAGLTEAAGAATGLSVWYSKNATDVDPSSSAWTGTWTAATFNVQSGNNDEWKGAITPIPGQADTYYSFRYQLNGGPMKYGGYSTSGGGFWDGTNNKNGKLSVNYEVYTTATAPNNTVNNSIDVYFKDYDGYNNFYSNDQTSIWMYAGVRTSTTNTWLYTNTTNPVQDLNNTGTLVEFVRISTNPNVYKATIKFADYFCIPNGTTVTGIDLLFRNQYDINVINEVNNINNKTVDLFLDLGDAAVSVSAPTIATATSVTTDSATLNWTAPTTGAVKGYDYYYSTSNTAPIATTTPSGSTAAGTVSAGITGLNPGTTYYFWARTKSCDGVSTWSNRGSFTTLCGVVTILPWSENFDSMTTIGSGIVQNCWSNVTGTKPWVSSNAATTTYNAPKSTPNYMSLQWSNTKASLLWTPGFALSANTSYDFSFYYYTGTDSSYNGWTGNVWVNNSASGTGATDLGVFISATQVATSYTKYTVSYTPTVSGTYYFALNVSSAGSNSWYLGVDDFDLRPTPVPISISSSETLPLCEGTPTTLTATSSAAYNYTWSPATGLGATTGASVTATPTTTTTYTVTGTTGATSTTKSITVVVNPAPDPINIVQTPVFSGGSTACDLDYVTLSSGVSSPKSIITEGFENATDIFTADHSNTLYANFYNDTTLKTEGTRSINFYGDYDDGPDYIALDFTNGIDLTKFASAKVTFDHICASQAGSDFGEIWYSTDGGTNWSPLPSSAYVGTAALKQGYVSFDKSSYPDWNSAITSSASVPTNSLWKSEVLDLSQFMTSSNFKLSFLYWFNGGTSSTTDYYGWNVDNIKVNVTPKIVWSPGNDLYTDAALTIPYIAGANATTVYAAPDVATDYSASSSFGACNTSDTETVQPRMKSQFTGLDSMNPTYWNDTDNWLPKKLPSADKCVLIPASKSAVVNVQDAVAKNVKVELDANLTINALQSLTVSEQFTNAGTGNNVVIQDGGNLLQGNDLPAVANSGNIRVEKLFTFTYYAPNNRQQYNYVSSPVIGGNLKDIYPGSPATLYHNQATNTFFNSSGANITGRALAVKEPSTTAVAAQTVTAAFNGVPFNGILNYPLAYTVATGVNPGFNLVGNPYPSNIDLELLYEDNKDKIEATFWLWDNRGNTEFKQLGSSYTGDNYAKYNAVSGTGVGIGFKAPNSPNNSVREPNQFVKVATGFMVRAKSDANTKKLDYKNSIRTSDNTGPGFFGKGAAKDRFWLTMETPSGMNFTNAVVYFANGKENYGPEDTKTFNSSDAIYTVVGDQKLAINGKGVFQSTDKVDLGLSHFVNGNYTISSGKKEGVFANGQHIYLKDRQTGIITNLTEGAYTFTANAGETTGRFEIMYQPETVLGTDGTAKEELKVYRDGQEYVISSPGRKITGVEVYDTSGKLMMKSTTAQTEVRLNGNTWTDGVYILKISRDGEVITKKVLK